MQVRFARRAPCPGSVPPQGPPAAGSLSSPRQPSCSTHIAHPHSRPQAGKADLQYIGMAPSAKLAFIDLGDGTSDSIYTPGDLEGGYFDYTYGMVGLA